MNQNKSNSKQHKTKYFYHHPSIKLTISTWNKDSHGLYDYESTPESYRLEKHNIENSTLIYRDPIGTSFINEAPRTILMGKSEQKQKRESFQAIANIVFEKKEAKSGGIVRFEALENQAQEPANMDSTKVFYKVIRDFSLESATKDGYPLKPGNLIKMGRVEYMVIEMRNNSDTSTIRDTNHFNENNVVFEYEKIQTIPEEEGCEIRCKVCLCSEETDEDPLISPCKCKGSLKKIHVGCLKQWINSKVKKEINDIATSYNFTKFECEICKCPFPKVIKMNEKRIEMMTICKPDKPYIILESLNKAEDQFAKEEKCLHLISAKDNSPIRIGRGHQCEIRLTDISVSRAHAEIIFANDEFFIKDQKSKFGTLIKFDGIHNFEAGKPLKVQYGRTLFEFELDVPEEEDTEEDMSQPVEQFEEQ